jgi:hypothetical protein
MHSLGSGNNVNMFLRKSAIRETVPHTAVGETRCLLSKCPESAASLADCIERQ